MSERVGFIESMFTKNDIHAQLEKMCVKRSDTVLMHTSMKAIGEVEGGAEGFLDIMIDYFAEDGLFLVPTHTWARAIAKVPILPTLDMSSDYTCIGLIPSLAAVHPLGHRSLNATHSMAAFGKGAEAYIAGEVMVETATNPRGCYGRLYDVGGKVLLVGVGHNRNTYIHSVEERLNVPNRLSKEPFPTTIRLVSGDVINRPLHEHQAIGCPDVSAHYPKFEPAFRAAGAITDGFLGNAPTQFCDCITMYRVIDKIHNAHPAELCFDDEPLPDNLVALAAELV